MSYSQCGEDLIIKDLIDSLGMTPGKCLEFGGADGKRQSNTRLFESHGWECHFWDISPESDDVKQVRVTRENIDHLIEENALEDIKMLSIDIDGNDYWVWEAMEVKPDIVVIEYNPMWTLGVSRVIEYDENHTFDRTNYFGASFSALFSLGIKKGYIHYKNTPLNMIFVSDAYDVDEGFNPEHITGRSGWPKDKKNREWMKI